jgi:hypothetical protein
MKALAAVPAMNVSPAPHESFALMTVKLPDNSETSTGPPWLCQPVWPPGWMVRSCNTSSVSPLTFTMWSPHLS